ncbi:MAG TPA: glycosyltransferase family 2 protein [Chryseosolibacter sp.]|nr:glycosyltransferase family 2 protein [Chryseosolibacter sp.]
MISIILPIYNESQNIPIILAALESELSGYDYEIIAVNDGSKDDSWLKLKSACAQNKKIKAINFRKNFGQTSAINAGIQEAKGSIIVLIDSDLENDPKDIPRLLEKLEQGYDVVSGWRQARWQGKYLTRKLPSVFANRLISYISGVKLHDYGCTLKAYKRDVVKDVFLYGQMHRFIPVYCSWEGGKVAEIPVTYQPRRHGKSNYGIFRTYKVVLDLIMMKFLDKYMQRPIHFFGGIGILSFVAAALSAVFALYLKFIGYATLIQTPLPTISAVFFIIGIQLVLMGVMAEILMRTYYESQGKMPFRIKEKINIG